MVNGTLSRILYVGAFVMMALCILGFIVIPITGNVIPRELELAFGSSIALIAGSHITPPNIRKTETGAVVEPAATYTVKSKEGEA